MILETDVDRIWRIRRDSIMLFNTELAANAHAVTRESQLGVIQQ